MHPAAPTLPTHSPTLHLFYVGYLWHSCVSSWDPHAALSQHKTNKSSPPSWLHLISSSRKWHIRKRLHRPFASTDNMAKVVLEAMKFSWWHFISEKWFSSWWQSPSETTLVFTCFCVCERYPCRISSLSFAAVDNGPLPKRGFIVQTHLSSIKHIGWQRFCIPWLVTFLLPSILKPLKHTHIVLAHP